MTGLLALRCTNHPAREAAARCPSCGRTFCRECVTEHDDRALCAACLAASRAVVGSPNRLPFGAALATIAGLLLAWALFFLAGRILVALPDQAGDAEVAGAAP